MVDAPPELLMVIGVIATPAVSATGAATDTDGVILGALTITTIVTVAMSAPSVLVAMMTAAPGSDSKSDMRRAR